MSNGVIATARTVIHIPIDQVWDALIDPECIATYMMGAKVTTDWQEGSPIVWKGEWKGKTFEDRGRVLKVFAPELLSYSHISGSEGADAKEHVVTIKLQEVAGITHVLLTQDNNPDEQAAKESEKNWTMMLDALKKLLGDAPVKAPEQPRA